MVNIEPDVALNLSSIPIFLASPKHKVPVEERQR